MKIFLEPGFLNLFSSRNFKSLIKIIKIKNKSTLINLRGRTLKIPFVLKKNGTYMAEIKNGVLEIKENTINFFHENTRKELIKSLKENLDKFFILVEDKDSYQSEIQNFFLSIIDGKGNEKRGKKKSHDKNYFLTNDKKEFFFIFNLPFYLQLTSVFIKINNRKEVFLCINTENGSVKNKREFEEELKNKLSGRVNNLFVNITGKKDEFYNNIYSLIVENSIDIEI